MEPTLVPAGPRDVPALARMVVALYREDAHGPVPMTAARARRQARAMLAAPDRVRPLLLALDGEIVGYVVLADFWSNEFGGPMLYLDELYVRPAWRGRGVGGAAVRAVLALARAEGRVRVSLEVNAGNPKAESLYRRLGFTSEPRTTLSVQVAPVED